MKISDFEPFREFAMKLGGGTVSILPGMRLLKPSVVATLLRAFSNQSIEKTVIRARLRPDESRVLGIHGLGQVARSRGPPAAREVSAPFSEFVGVAV